MKHQKAVNITKRAEMLQKYRASALFMRRSVQRKYAAKVTHRLHGEKGRRKLPFSVVHGRREELCSERSPRLVRQIAF